MLIKDKKYEFTLLNTPAVHTTEHACCSHYWTRLLFTLLNTPAVHTTEHACCSHLHFTWIT